MKLCTILIVIFLTASTSLHAQVVTDPWATIGSGAQPRAIAVDASGNSYTANYWNSTVSMISSSGALTFAWATLASGANPRAIIVDGSGNVYTANGNNTINKINASGAITQTWSISSGAQPTALAMDGSGNIYVTNYGTNTVSKIDATGVLTDPWVSLASGSDPQCLALDASGNVYTGNYNNGTGTVSKITTTGSLTQSWATISSGYVVCLHFDSYGNLYGATDNYTMFKVTPSVSVTDPWVTLTNTGSNTLRFVLDDLGNIYTVSNTSNLIGKINPSGTVLESWAALGSAVRPRGIAIDSYDNLYTANSTANINSGTASKIATYNYWSGGTSTDWSNAANWNFSNIPNSNDKVVIPSVSNKPLIGNGVNAVADKLTLQNGATLTVNGTGTLVVGSGGITVNPGAALVGNSSNVTGSVTLQQNIIAQRGWRIFANPFITSQTFTSLSSSNNVTINTSVGPAGIADTRVFNNSGNAWTDAGTSTTANTAYGLFIRGIKSDISGGGTGLTYAAGPTAFTYSVSGTLNGNSFTVPSATVSNFSLVGNPYAAPVNSQALTGGTAQSYYLYQISRTGNGQTKAGSWSTVLTSDNTSPIPVLGVIALKTAGNYSVSTSDINTTNAAATGLFGIETPIPHIELQVEQNGNQQDNMFVRLDPAATVKGTDKIDLVKFYNDNVNVYSITTADNSRLAVDARNVLSNIPIGISALAGDYNFKLADNNLPEGSIVYLNDKFLNTKTELKVGDTYNFSITTDAASYGEQRFELSFSIKTTATANDPSGSLIANVLGNITSSNLIAVQIGGAKAPVTIGIKDMSGTSIRTINAVNGIQYINVGNTAKGMLLLHISDGKSSIIKKIMKL